MRNYCKINRISRKRRINSKGIKGRIRNKKRIYHAHANTGRRKRWSKRKKIYRTQAKKPILGVMDLEWDRIMKFERKWGVMRRGREWPKF